MLLSRQTQCNEFHIDILYNKKVRLENVLSWSTFILSIWHLEWYEWTRAVVDFEIEKFVCGLHVQFSTCSRSCHRLTDGTLDSLECYLILLSSGNEDHIYLWNLHARKSVYTVISLFTHFPESRFMNRWYWFKDQPCLIKIRHRSNSMNF
jgi:hypothetical protein